LVIGDRHDETFVLSVLARFRVLVRLLEVMKPRSVRTQERMKQSWQVRLRQGLACPGSWVQTAGIVALAVVAGLAFNRSNPVGLDLSSSAPAAGPRPKVATGATPTSPSAPQAPLVAPKLGDLEEPAKKAVTTRITWAEVKPLLESHAVVLVDARPAAAFAAGHVPGAVSLPEKSAPAVLAAFAALHAKDQRIVTYCSDKSCSASMRLAQSLTDHHGFQAVQFMPGGYQEWQRDQSLAP
jgi:rhodanese-related sulfurtransferase